MVVAQINDGVFQLRHAARAARLVEGDVRLVCRRVLMRRLYYVLVELELRLRHGAEAFRQLLELGI